MRDAFVSPLRDRSGRDAAEIRDLARPAQRVNDSVCVHARHHMTCAGCAQELFDLTKNACIIFFSPLKSSHRSTEHRAAMFFRRPAHRRTHAPRPLQPCSSKQNQLGATSTPMGAADLPASPRRSGPASNAMQGAAQPHATYGGAVPGRQPRAKRLHRQPDAVTGPRLRKRAHKRARWRA